MIKFWVKVSALLILPLVVFAVNWIIDPVHLRGNHQYEYGIAKLLLEGKRVTNISNPSDANLVQFYVAGLRTRKEVLVFGSSRSKLLRADSFPGRTFYNNSIGGAGLVDYLAIYQLYRQKKLLPSIAVIELSPWILNRDYASIWSAFNRQKSELERRLVLAPAADGAAIDFGADEQHYYSQFLSLGYFQTAFFTWLNAALAPSQHTDSSFVWQEGTLAVGETILADGSTIYPERVQNSHDLEHVRALALEYGQKPIGLPKVLDDGRAQVLEAFVDRLLNDGVRPVLYLPPYHPKTYALMAADRHNRIVVEAQQRFQALADRKHLTLIGSYNPHDLALDETVFFDGSHPNPAAVQTIFAGVESAAKAQLKVATLAADQIEVIGINNSNGLEVVNDKPFFWMGRGETVLITRSARAGTARLSFYAQPGPSLPTTQKRKIELRAGDYSETLVIDGSATVETSFAVQLGQNETRLIPLDQPSVGEQQNTDRRPLLIGVSDLQITLQPARPAAETAELRRNNKEN